MFNLNFAYLDGLQRANLLFQLVERVEKTKQEREDLGPEKCPKSGGEGGSTGGWNLLYMTKFAVIKLTAIV